MQDDLNRVVDALLGSIRIGLPDAHIDQAFEDRLKGPAW
jgi:hypothetical protein